jgi:hypothetical protein
MSRFMTDLTVGAQCTILVDPAVIRRVIRCPIIWACEFTMCAAFSSRRPSTRRLLISMVSAAGRGRHPVGFVFGKVEGRGCVFGSKTIV